MKLIENLVGYLYSYMTVMDSRRGMNYIYLLLIPMTLFFLLIPLAMPIHFLWPKLVSSNEVLGGVGGIAALTGIIAMITLAPHSKSEQLISQPKFQTRRAIFIGALLRLGSIIFFMLYTINGIWAMKVLFNVDIQSVF